MLGAHVASAHRAGPVLTGHGAADLDRELVQPIRELVRATDLIGIVGVHEDR